MDPVLLTASRQERGLALAKAKPRAFRPIAGDSYFVPSQSNAAGYVVDLACGSCTCPDFEERGGVCKHQWAVRYVRHELAMPDGTSVVTESIRLTYQQDWPRYNAAQCEEKRTAQTLLSALCDGLVTPPHPGRGPKPTPLADRVFAMTWKVYTTVSARRATSDIEACIPEGAPRYNTVLEHFGKQEVTPILQALVSESARPLAAVERDFAVDATGFAGPSYVRYFDYRHGHDRRVQKWVKLHAMVGTATNAIVQAEVTDATVGDSPMLAPLLRRAQDAGFQLAEVSADKAYLSRENAAAVERVGARPFVPFKSNSAPWNPSRGSDAWERMRAYFTLNREEFLAHYHKRSNVESTFSAVKRKFGENVRSKNWTAQCNEVLCKCLCFNLSVLVHAIHELGIDPRFWQPREVQA